MKLITIKELLNYIIYGLDAGTIKLDSGIFIDNEFESAVENCVYNDDGSLSFWVEKSNNKVRNEH